LSVPLVAFVPEGADLVLVARPAVVLESPVLASLVTAVVPDDRLEAFAQRTGVDLRRLREAVVADYGPEGSLWLARGPFDASLAVTEVAERLATLESRADAPLTRCAGFVGNDRLEVVALAPDALVLARGEGAVRPLGALLACRLGRACRPALAPESVRALLRAHASEPIAVYAPRGIELPEGVGAQALFAGVVAGVASIRAPRFPEVRSPRASAGAVGLDPASAGRSPGDVSNTVTLTLDLRGRFPATVAENLRALLRAVGASAMGGAFGLEEIGDTARIDVGPGRVTVTLEIAAPAFRVGLRALAGAELAELVGGASSP
jgi:hypothetical protein